MLVPIALRRPDDLSSSLKINSADCQLRPATTRPRYLLVRCRCADAWHALGTGLFEDQSSVPRIASQILSLWTKVATITGARSTRRENRAAACCHARITVKIAYLPVLCTSTYVPTLRNTQQGGNETNLVIETAMEYIRRCRTCSGPLRQVRNRRAHPSIRCPWTC